MSAEVVGTGELGGWAAQLPASVYAQAMGAVVVESEVVIEPGALEADPERCLGEVRDFVARAAAAGRTIRVSAEERWFTPREAAELLGVSRSSVQRAILSGGLKSQMRGSHHRVPESEVSRFRRGMLTRMAEVMADDF